jgi:hypothetical protein
MSKRKRLSLAALAITAALVLGACGGSAQPGSAGSGGSALTPSQASDSGSGSPGGGSPEASSSVGDQTDQSGQLVGAATNLQNLKSYRFSMTLVGVAGLSTLADLAGVGISGNAPISLSGTIVWKPAPASDMTVGNARFIELNGTLYVDQGTGSFISTPAGGLSLAGSFAPAAMYSSMTGATAEGFSKVGTEQKNGVSADHYKGDQTAAARFATLAGIGNASWTADVWIATDGGYPVAMAIVGKANGALVYEVQFDITNVNDPSNAVTAPAG